MPNNSSSPLPSRFTEQEVNALKAAVVWAEVHYQDDDLGPSGEELVNSIEALLGTPPWDILPAGDADAKEFNPS